MNLNLAPDELLTTTRSVRKRLDFDRQVDHSVVMECLDIALQAPSGSNKQGWQWLFVTDADHKLALRDIYLANFEAYRNMPRPEYEVGDPRSASASKVADSAYYLAQNFHKAPILMIPCLEGRPESPGASGNSAAFWGSILPAVWSFMLALRERGLGSAWTTLHLPGGGEQRAAEMLGIPFDRYSQAGLFPIAHTIGTDFKRAQRLSAESVTRWETW